MSSASIMAEIRRKEAEKKKKEEELKKIIAAMQAVDAAWAGVEGTGYKNSFNYIKNNSSNYWNVVDGAGNSCGDVVSFNNALDSLVQEISSGEVATAMGEVMAKAAEKVAELEAQIAALEEEIARLYEAYEAALRAEEAAAARHDEQQSAM